MENILEIKNLNVGFNIEINRKTNFYYALNDINLSFEKGKIHAIAGESGCGKSVLINTILKLLPKNSEIKSGEIIFNNENLLKLKEKDFQKIRGKKISLIPQDPFMSLNPRYTIENQLLEVPTLKNNKDAKNIITSALEEVNIKNVIIAVIAIAILLIVLFMIRSMIVNTRKSRRRSRIVKKYNNQTSQLDWRDMKPF